MTKKKVYCVTGITVFLNGKPFELQHMHGVLDIGDKVGQFSELGERGSQPVFRKDAHGATWTGYPPTSITHKRTKTNGERK